MLALLAAILLPRHISLGRAVQVLVSLIKIRL
jgi:hypothetical protein